MFVTENTRLTSLESHDLRIEHNWTIRNAVVYALPEALVLLVIGGARGRLGLCSRNRTRWRRSGSARHGRVCRFAMTRWSRSGSW